MKYFEGTQEYIATPELREIVSVSIALEKPLVIRGEPGTGKTLLAKAVAEYFNYPLYTWHVKSTSKAAEGLYVYDAIQRLNDSRFGDGDVSDIARYIKLGPLGQAFDSGEPSVVLIDEIDKADMEFPNDLLHELDAMNFMIYETGRVVKAKKRPIVIITSNAEKELPDAFLRRCIFHYLSFPTQDEMKKIIDVHHPDLKPALMDRAMAKFYWLRDQEEVRKKPSTSELVDWLAALVKGGIDPKTVEKEWPFLGVLLKKESDLMHLQRRR